MRTALFAATLFLLAGNVLADPQPWMKKENPEELYVHFDIDGCFSGDYEQAVDQALAWAGIKRGEEWRSGDLVVAVKVDCQRITIGAWADKGADPIPSYAYHVVVQFGRMLSDDGIHVSELLLYQSSEIESIGWAPDTEGGLEALEITVRDWLRRLLTDYLKANFDL